VAATSTVLFNDLSRAAAALGAEIEAALARVVGRGWFVLGEEGEAFEAEFAAAAGANHAVGVASGTDAIELALRALELGPGDEVVTQANTCVPTVSAIERLGAVAVLCDVEPGAGSMDPSSLAAVVGPKTRAVVPVHLYGQCGDLDAIGAVADEHGLAIVEDCAQAHGARLGDRAVGTIGRLGCFSFYPTKNLGALGDAGAVTTDDDGLAERLRLLRNYGQTDRYTHESVGVNSRLDELQAAVLRVKLPHLDEWNLRRAEIARAYTAALAGGPVRALDLLPSRTHAFHLFVAAAPDRAAFQAHLAGEGVQTLVHYPTPVHRQPAYRRLADGPVPLTNAERLCAEVVSLPIYPELRTDEVERVVAAIKSFPG
jgi:dTDP-3-amino-3,4,6-trideoxy-alpha-D-glucose transaminase